MKSIIQENTEKCFFCGKRATEEHHCIYGTANRKLSEKYGLKVYLCHFCHNEPHVGVHFNRTRDIYVKRVAQEAFEKEYPNLDFLRIFGRNYLD